MKKELGTVYGVVQTTEGLGIVRNVYVDFWRAIKCANQMRGRNPKGNFSVVLFRFGPGAFTPWLLEKFV